MFKEMHQFYTFMCLSPYKYYIQSMVKIGPVVLEKMLTHNGSQPIEIGHSSDSGDQKNVSFSMNFSKLADESNIFKNLPKQYIIYRL